MRWEKTAALLDLARALPGTAEGLTLDDMAARARVDRRTAERMRDALRTVFPMLEELADGKTKRFRIGGGLEAFFRTPTPEELAELEIATRGLDAAGAADRAALLRSLAAKVRATLRQRDMRRIEPDLAALMEGEGLVMQAGPRPLANTSILRQVREAIKAARTCIFDYQDANGRSIRRTVNPYGILFGRNYYLVGSEFEMQDPRLWRFDRMSAFEVGSGSGGLPLSFNLSDYAMRSFGVYQEPVEQIELRFLKVAAGDARQFSFHPRQQCEECSDGSVIIRFTAGGLMELAHHLFTWGDGVVILSPDRLRRIMTAELKRALEAHSAPAP